jgi:hypothetical protein
LSRKVNPEFAALGDETWGPDVISTTWYQAETGKIPVSGAGYGGRFVGQGFDSMWTDMSEIVRPTRDGIHGREYISTAVDVGRKFHRLDFDGSGEVADDPPPLIEIPVPVVFDAVRHLNVPESVALTSASAAQGMGNLAIVPSGKLTGSFERFAEVIVPLYDESVQPDDRWVRKARMVEVPYAEDIVERIAALKKLNPSLVVGVRAKLNRRSAQRALELTRMGVEVMHFYADAAGQEWEENRPRHISRATREVHLALVEAKVRDEVTLIASGGVALAEHLAKEIICGADVVAIDMPIAIALECRICGSCLNGLSCPVDLDRVDIGYATQRLMNLMGAWRSQLLEVLGAMGLREVRRLRGELGRAMFFEDLERESFGPIFGKRKTEEKLSATA